MRGLELFLPLFVLAALFGTAQLTATTNTMNSVAPGGLDSFDAYAQRPGADPIQVGTSNFIVPAGSLSTIFANVKVMLQGPYNTGTSQMDNALKTGGYLTARFGPNVKSTAVDSITVEIRNAPTAAGSTIRLFQPAWLLQDGTIVSFNDSTKAYTAYSGALAGNYYIVVWHRNHLAIMSATAQALTGSAPPAYNFTTGQSQAFGVNPMIQVNAAPLVFAMVAGDGDGTGVVVAADANAVFGALSVPGYNKNDINLSGLVSASDANVVFGNLSRATQVSRPVQNPGETGVELGKVTRKLPAVINKEDE